MRSRGVCPSGEFSLISYSPRPPLVRREIRIAPSRRGPVLGRLAYSMSPGLFAHQL